MWACNEQYIQTSAIPQQIPVDSLHYHACHTPATQIDDSDYDIFIAKVDALIKLGIISTLEQFKTT